MAQTRPRPLRTPPHSKAVVVLTQLQQGAAAQPAQEVAAPVPVILLLFLQGTGQELPSAAHRRQQRREGLVPAIGSAQECGQKLPGSMAPQQIIVYLPNA